MKQTGPLIKRAVILMKSFCCNFAFDSRGARGPTMKQTECLTKQTGPWDCFTLGRCLEQTQVGQPNKKNIGKTLRPPQNVGTKKGPRNGTPVKKGCYSFCSSPKPRVPKMVTKKGPEMGTKKGPTF